MHLLFADGAAKRTNMKKEDFEELMIEEDKKHE